MLLYFNNLKELPNFGCRTTGKALRQLISKHNEIASYDAMESVNFSGAWDAYARGPLRHGGALPRSLYEFAWRLRSFSRRGYNVYRLIDRMLGARHDYILKNPERSLEEYERFSRTNPRIADLRERIQQCNGVVINGEGTLIIGNPTLRDALYLLFVIALAKKFGKKVYLLNAMVAPCPYRGEDPEVLRQALPLLQYCERIAVRETQSYEYLSEKIGESNLELVPDALFTWGDRIRACSQIVRREPLLAEAHPEVEEFSLLELGRPYICISGSSSAWRHKDIGAQFPKLVAAVKRAGYSVCCVETCDGDSFLRGVAKECGVRLVPKTTPALAAAGILAGSLLYITGRYHPAIMASASGTPCIFLSSNSHKTSSIQSLLGYREIVEHSVCPDDDEIDSILHRIGQILADREVLSREIRENFDQQARRAARYESII